MGEVTDMNIRKNRR